ncbi:Bacterial extracellular solute-binding protein, family 3 [compost metagenome]
MHFSASKIRQVAKGRLHFVETQSILTEALSSAWMKRTPHPGRHNGRGGFMACKPSLCGLALTLAAGLCAAAPATNRFGCEEPLRLAFHDSDLFYRDGQGIDADLLAELQLRSGCSFEASVRPREEIWKALAAGELDMATGGTLNAERRRQAFFLPYAYVREKLIVPLRLAAQVRTLGDVQQMPGARLGVIAGHQHGVYIESMLRILGATGRVQEYPDEAAAFGALFDGRIEALVGHEQNLSGSARDPDSRKQYRVFDVAEASALVHGLMLSRRHFSPAQSAEWQRLMDGLRLDGSLARIVHRNASPEAAADLLDSSNHRNVME